MTENNRLGKSGIYTFITHAGALFTVCCWGLSFVATKVIMDGAITPTPLSPTEAYLYRFIIAYAVILLLCHKKLFCDNLKDEMLMLLCGMTSGSIYFIAENTALELTYTSNVSLLTSTSPLLTVIIVGLLYKSERPGLGTIIGSCIAFAGVGCVIFNSSTSIDIQPLGDMISMGAALSWAFYSLIVRKLNVVYDAMFITRKTFFYGIVTAFPFLFSEREIYNPIAVFSNGWPVVDGCLLFLALFPSVIAFYLWAITIKRLGPINANNYMYLQPVVTVIASAFILGEKVSLLGYIGFLLILLGLSSGYYLEKVFGLVTRSNKVDK